MIKTLAKTLRVSRDAVVQTLRELPDLLSGERLEQAAVVMTADAALQLNRYVLDDV